MCGKDQWTILWNTLSWSNFIYSLPILKDIKKYGENIWLLLKKGDGQNGHLTWEMGVTWIHD